MNWYIRIHFTTIEVLFVMWIFFSFQMSIGHDDFCSQQVVGVVAVLEVM
jgi:hypothetical protein